MRFPLERRRDRIRGNCCRFRRIPVRFIDRDVDRNRKRCIAGEAECDIVVARPVRNRQRTRRPAMPPLDKLAFASGASTRARFWVGRHPIPECWSMPKRLPRTQSTPIPYARKPLINRSRRARIRRKPLTRNRERSIEIDGRKTSVSLEDEFWNALMEIAAALNLRPSDFVATIHRDRDGANLSSATRV